jgi:hypothetical protein
VQPTLSPVWRLVAVGEYPGGHPEPALTTAPTFQVEEGGETQVLPQQSELFRHKAPHVFAGETHRLLQACVVASQVGVVFAAPAGQSLFEQQPLLGTQRVVPGQFLKPLLQLMPQVPLLQTAPPFEVGAGQALQAVPQKLLLLSVWQIPLQLWVPDWHIPLHALALAMHAPMHSLVPFGQDEMHERPSQETDPPPVGD